MSGAAKMNAKILSIGPEKYTEPTTLNVNLKKHPTMDTADVGKPVHFHGHGVVKSIRKDQYGHSMSVDVKKIQAMKKPLVIPPPATDEEQES